MPGGDRCLEAFCELFPTADLFTLVHVPGSVSPVVERQRVVTSFIQRLPDAGRNYRCYLPFFAAAICGFDLAGYDLVLSSSHAAATSVRPRGALHVCHRFTPMRYVWDLYDEYFGARAGPLTRWVMPPVAAALRRWDRRTAAGVAHFVAISRFVAERIRRCYGRDADVIYPPVDVTRFSIDEAPGDCDLVVSALTPYKRVDLAVEAASRTGRRLVVVGTGPEERRLRALAGSTVEFLGWRDDAEVAQLHARRRALRPSSAALTGRSVAASVWLSGRANSLPPLRGGRRSGGPR